MRIFRVTQIPINQIQFYHQPSKFNKQNIEHIWLLIKQQAKKHKPTKQSLKQDAGIGVIIALLLFGVHMEGQKVSSVAAHAERIKVLRKINKTPNLKAHVSINKKRDFIHQFAFLAEQQQDDSNISPSIVIAQAAIESQWGKSVLYQKDNNAFGVKGYYYGKSATYYTTEVINGSTETIRAPFKKYPSVKDSIVDHDKLLRSIFKKEHAKKDDYVSEAKALQKGDYATDPNYAKKIMLFIQQNKLARFD